MSLKFFITGTDTGVGKTLVSCALLSAANSKGMKSLGLKPLAAGCEPTSLGWCNDDALALQRCASVKLPYQQINPIALKEALAPHIAAEREGKRLSVDRLVGFCRGAIQAQTEFCVIEGAGGWRVPLNSAEYLSALPKALNLPVILVVGMRLGCLNHARLSAEAILGDGLALAGWVANVVDDKMPALDENIAALTRALPGPLLGAIPYLAGTDMHDMASKAAAYLNIDPLVQAL